MTDDTTHTTETTTETVGESTANATMGEFSHTNPHTGKAFGDDFAFKRGPAVAADGGERNAEDEDDEETMREVDHEHPEAEAEDANRVFQRGNEEHVDSE